MLSLNQYYKLSHSSGETNSETNEHAETVVDVK
jgi:hypothetical protein